MPALIDIRRRIRSVKSTQQITKAMKMVSAAKLRRAQEAMFAARPYARKMMEVLNSMASRATPDAHPLLEERGHEKVLLVVITADKGLCGAFNANIIRTATRFLADRGDGDVDPRPRGAQGPRLLPPPGGQGPLGAGGGLPGPALRDRAGAGPGAHGRVHERRGGPGLSRLQRVQERHPAAARRRPAPAHRAPRACSPQEPALDYLYEPEPAGIFATILPKHVEVQVWKALLESQAAEHGARMTSMDAATNNASEMIDRLTLYMNKVRQAAITKEIIEVVSGAGAPS